MTDRKLGDLKFSTASNKLHGVYPQKQVDLYMQRIKIPGGRINPLQWRTIAQIQKSFTLDTAVHLTTRQDIELHNLHPDNVVKAQQMLIDAGLFIYGAGGDALRNITVCSGCGLCPESYDCFDISIELEKYLQTLDAAANLPRKFKISFSGCRKNCAKPYLNDIGFIVTSDKSFEVIIGGSLGPIPALGIKVYDNLPVSDSFALCRAAMEMFADIGERDNRRKARLRHLRQKLGDEAFISELEKRFKQAAKETQPKINSLNVCKSGFKLLYSLNIPDGDISTDDILLLADFCEYNSIESRINFEHGIELYGCKQAALPENLKKFENGLVVIACQGGRTCPYGLINTQAAASKVRDAVAGDTQFSNAHINISGCLNNCAHSAAAAIGMVGSKRNNQECVQLYVGGGEGKNQNLAQKLGVENVNKIHADFLKSIKIAEPLR